MAAPFELFPFISDIKSDLDLIFKAIMETKSVTLVAEPKLNQLVALSFLEASFLDKGILYHRKLVEQVDENSLTDENLHIFFNEVENNNNSVKIIPSKEITISLGQNNTPRIGKLDIVGMSGCLALMIGKVRVEKLLPLILAGNWLRTNLDFTYDPVFTSIRDSLEKNGEISVVSIVEISEPDLIELPGIDSNELNSLREEWINIDLEKQSEKLSRIVKPLLKSSIGVARLEELIWHRVIKKDWDSDLASQCSKAQRELKSSSQKIVSASRLVDEIIRNGKLC